jgi:hypothetical protein
MIRNKLLICSEVVIKEAETNNISIINLFDQIAPAGFPFFFTKLAILHVYEREEGDPEEISINLKFELGAETIFSTDLNSNFQGKKQARNIVVLNGIVLKQPGVLKVTATPLNSDPISYEININPPNTGPAIISR